MGSKNKEEEGYSNSPSRTKVPVLVSVIPVPKLHCHFFS